MRQSHLKKTLSASAILATSVAAAVSGIAPAQASQAGTSSSPLTISNGTNQVVENGSAVSFLSTVADASWAPDGSRVAFVNSAGAVVTARPDGSWPLVLAPAKAGVTRSHPTWIDNGTAVAFAEASGGTTTLQAVPADQDGLNGLPTPENSPITYLPAGFTAGTESAPDANAKETVFQHHNAATNTDEVWIEDGFGRGTDGPHLVADGTQPAVSPDGTKVAFVTTDKNGDAQLMVATWDESTEKAGTPVAITATGSNHVRPTWSPDGTRIAFEATAHGTGTPVDVESVAAAGGGLKVESAKPGAPAYQPLAKDTETRVFGNDRTGTAIATSKAAWPTAPAPGASQAQAVVLSRDDDFADALGGSALAGVAQAPLLLTSTAALNPAVKAEIVRVLGKVNTAAPQKVYILGGEKALSPAVFNAVKALGYNPVRLGGTDRYASSVDIAKQIVTLTGVGAPQRVLVATGLLAPDALSAGAAATASGGGGQRVGVVLLSANNVMPSATAAYIGQIKAVSPGTQFYGIGHQGDNALISDHVVHTQVAGNDRFQTSYLVARTFFNGWNDEATAPTSVGFATSVTWPDALSGGAFMAHQNGPLLVVDPKTGPSSDESTWISGWSSSLKTATVFGGTAAVGDPAAAGIARLVSGPAGVTDLVNPLAK